MRAQPSFLSRITSERCWAQPNILQMLLKDESPVRAFIFKQPLKVKDGFSHLSPLSKHVPEVGLQPNFWNIASLKCWAFRPNTLRITLCKRALALFHKKPSTPTFNFAQFVAHATPKEWWLCHHSLGVTTFQGLQALKCEPFPRNGPFWAHFSGINLPLQGQNIHKIRANSPKSRKNRPQPATISRARLKVGEQKGLQAFLRATPLEPFCNFWASPKSYKRGLEPLLRGLPFFPPKGEKKGSLLPSQKVARGVRVFEMWPVFSQIRRISSAKQ